MRGTSKTSWQQKRLNELGFVGRGKSKHRPRNDASLYGGRYPFIQTGEIKAANLYISKYSQTYNENGLAQSKLWEPGTLCITIAANIAETAILKIRACFPDSVVGFIADPAKSDTRFIKYCLDTLKLQMQNISRGTTQDNLPVEKLLSFKLSVPPVLIQRKIAGILSAYDDLIENNTRRVQILEEVAQRIYKEWVVGFRFPGYEKTKFIDSEIGKIPSNWQISTMGQIADIQWGDTSKTKASYAEDGYDAYSASGLDGKLDHYDFDRTGIVLSAIGANCGLTWFANGKWSCIKNTIRFWATSDIVSTEFLFFVTKDKNIWHRRGAAQPFISQGDAKKILVLCPSKEISDQFTKIASSHLKAIAVLENKNANLRKTRDFLLPKLISGDVDISGMDIVMRE